MGHKIKTPEDIKIGFGTFKKGVSFEIVKTAVDKHNEIYKALLQITPTERVNEIVRSLNKR